MKPFVGSIWNTQKKLPEGRRQFSSTIPPSSSGEITEASPKFQEFNNDGFLPGAPWTTSYVINMSKKKKTW